MRLYIRDLQDAYDMKFTFPMYLIRYSKITYWYGAPPSLDQKDFEVLAMAAVARKGRTAEER